MKLIKFIFGIIIAVVILVLAFAVFLAIMILDFNIVEPDYLKDKTTFALDTESSISRAISYAKDESKINFYLTEEELNILLKSTAEEINESFDPLDVRIDAFYVDLLNDKDIKYTSYITAYGLTTSIKGQLKFSQTESHLVLELSDFTLGSLNLHTSILKDVKVSGKNINDYLSDALADSELKFEYSESGKLKILFNNNQVIKLLLENAKKNASTFVTPVLNAILDSEKTIGFTENQFNFGTDLSKFKLNNKTDYLKISNHSCEIASNVVETLLNNNSISIDDCNAVANFIMNGFNKLSESDKAKIKKLDLSSIEITNNENYDGIVEFEKRSISEIMLSEKASDNTIKLSENMITNYLLSEGLVGQMTCYIRKDDNKYNVSYIGIEDIYIDINNNSFDLYFNISIDGFVMPIVLSSQLLNCDGLRNEFELKKVRLGSVELTDNIEMVNFLAKNLKLDWFYFRASENKIIIDFSNVYRNHSELSQLLSDDLTMSLYGDKLSGYLMFYYN